MIDQNDLQFVTERYGRPTSVLPCPIKNGKINPHVSRFIFNKFAVDVIHIKPIYYQSINREWRPLSEVTSYHGNRKIYFKTGWERFVHPRFISWLITRQSILKGELLLPSSVDVSLQKVCFLTSTFYPDPHPETTTFDGFAGYEATGGAPDQDWPSIITMDGNDGDDAGNGTTATQSAVYAKAYINSGRWYELHRGIYLFDTTSINDASTILSGTVSLYGYDAYYDVAGSAGRKIYLVGATTSSNTAVTFSDFENSGGTKLSDTEPDFTTFALGSYQDYPLNASGLGNLSKTDISKFGLRLGGDFDAISPSWGSGYLYRVSPYYAEQTGTDKDPKLVVTHTGLLVQSQII